ncbi:MAG: amidohydrolase family protein [Firmicutes bacterium]|nr:amidohydrolase family protein [Bacillota bacterium]
MKKIDCHVHLGNGIKMQLDEYTLLKQMDKAGVDFAITCPMDRYLTVANREGNKLIAGAVKNHPDRFAGMASVNPWFGKEACDELRKALDDGLMGLKLHPVIHGFRLADPLVYPLLEIADEYKVPVYVHTGTAGIAEPFHAAELARLFQHVNFIMGHGGASDYYNDTIRALEFADNLWIETSRNGPANFCH